MLGTNLCFGLDPSRAVTQYGHDNWQSTQGLPQNTVEAIAQTPDGYLWVGTQEGLSRFDGVRFTVFNRRNTPALLNQDIHALAVGPEGELWIGTEDGLVLYHRGVFRRFGEKDGLIFSRIMSLAVDPKGTLWIGTRGRGLFRKTGNRFEGVQPEIPVREIVWSVCAAPDGTVWAGLGTGVLRWKDGVLTKFTVAEGLTDNLVSKVHLDKNGILWAGTAKGLSRFAEGRFEASPEAVSARANIRSLWSDRDGNLWAGTPGTGLIRVQGTKSSTLQQGAQLSANYVVSLFEDREGSLWIGTQGAGLDRLKNTKILPFGAPEGLPGMSGRLVLQRADGKMVFGTEEGLSLVDDAGVRVIVRKEDINNAVIHSLAEDHEGYLWIGTQDGVVRRWKNGRIDSFPLSNKPSRDLALAIFEDHAHQLWVGTTAGLKRWDGKGWISYGTADGLAHNFVRAIAEDQQGNLWLGTYGGGVSRLQNGKFTTLNKAMGLSSNLVESLKVTRDGRVWAGTADGGINAIENGKITPITSAVGLFDDRIFQILEDESGALWMGCNRGVFSVSQAEIQRYLQGKAASVVSTSYGEADGMRSAECNGGEQPSGWVSRDGSIWLPTVKGFVAIHPKRMQLNLMIPPVRIEATRIDGKDTKTENLTLPAGARSLEIDYAALSYLAPDQVRFRYRLEGRESGWTDAGNRRTAYYTNLAPGSYRFHVIASNNDGIWNEVGSRLEFRMEPYFYQTNWFLMLCVTAVILMGWTGFQFRVRQLEAKHRLVLEERTRVARELHDTLLQGFAGVSMQLEAVSRKLKNQGEPAALLLADTLNLVDRCLADARESVWDLRSPLLDKRDLSDALRALCSEGASEGTEIRFEQIGARREIGVVVGQQLLRIAQEAMANAQRHAQATLVEVRLSSAADELTLEVVDNGRGMPEKIDDRGHWGIVGMRERASRIGASFQIESQLNHGTKVTVRLKSSG